MDNDDPIQPEQAGPLDNLPDSTKPRIESLFEKFEMMAMRHGAGGLDLSALNDQQRDKLLSVVEKNEEHAFQFYQEKLRTKRDIKLKEIEAGNFTFKTNRITLVIVLLALFTITIVVLATRGDFFVPWLTFLTGLIGGYGFAKTAGTENKKTEEK